MNEKETVMHEEEQKNSDQTAEQAPVEQSEAQLSPKRRSALVTYLSVLFAVAFLFVALMMIMEARRLKTMNEELKDSSQKTSASLTNNINALQAENQKLSQRNEELDLIISRLEEEAKNETARTKALQARLDTAEAEITRMEAELATASEALEEANQKSEDAIRVSELLQEAISADLRGQMNKLQELLEQIEPLKDLLSATEQEIYEELKIA